MKRDDLIVVRGGGDLATGVVHRLWSAGLRVLAQWGAGYGCAAVLLGNTVSEGVSCGVMLAFAARTPL